MVFKIVSFLGSGFKWHWRLIGSGVIKVFNLLNFVVKFLFHRLYFFLNQRSEVLLSFHLLFLQVLYFLYKLLVCIFKLLSQWLILLWTVSFFSTMCVANLSFELLYCPFSQLFFLIHLAILRVLLHKTVFHSKL